MEFILSLILPYLERIIHESNPARLAESLIVLAILWRKIKPHLNKIEDRMQGMESGLNAIGSKMTKGFEIGDKRFVQIETRLTRVELQQGENTNES